MTFINKNIYLQMMNLIEGVMKIVVKTLKKVVFEVSKKEMNKRGFDDIWDEIRSSYPPEGYDIHIVDHNKKNIDFIFFELIATQS